MEVSRPDLATTGAPKRELLGNLGILLHERLDLAWARHLVGHRHVEEERLRDT